MLGIRRFVGQVVGVKLRGNARTAGDFTLKKGILDCCKMSSHCGSRTKYTISYAHGNDYVEKPHSLVGKTFGQAFDETTELYPDNSFVTFTHDGIRRTFYQFQQERDRLAAGLLSLGIERGDRVGIWSMNNLEWVLTMMAAARIGAILVNLNPAYQRDELEYAMKKVDVKVIVASPPFKTQNFYEILADICPELETASPGQLKSQRLPNLKSVIMIGKEQPGAFAFEDVMDMGRTEHFDMAERITKRLQFDDIINIQFTSGTTGSPKATCLTHYCILNNVAMFQELSGIGGADKTLCLPVPLFHIVGIVLISMGFLYGNHTVFPSAMFNAKTTLHACHVERCTGIVPLPTMLIDILNHPEFANFDLSHLELLLTGGSPIPLELLRLTNRELPGTKTQSGYGMTEASAIVTMVRDTDPELSKLTAGRVVPHTEVKIVDPLTNEIVKPNVSGELCVRGPCVMTGYWGDEEKTKESIDPARWLHSGDLATMDEDGYIRIVGRSKDMIIRGGENIFPVQIEDFLYTHPKIEQVQVVGVPDKRLIEELCACIKLKEGQDCTEEEIKAFCKGKISHFMVPRYVQFVDEFPMTISRKVQKFKLREEMITKLKLEIIE